MRGLCILYTDTVNLHKMQAAYAVLVCCERAVHTVHRYRQFAHSTNNASWLREKTSNCTRQRMRSIDTLAMQQCTRVTANNCYMQELWTRGNYICVIRSTLLGAQ